MRVLLILALARMAVCDLRFAVHGDWGNPDPGGLFRQTEINAIMDQWCTQQACDFIMSTGDNFYPDGAEAADADRFNFAWRDIYTGASIRDLVHYISIGNHDHYYNNEIHQLQFAETEPRWYFPHYYYNVTMQKDGIFALFYAMDTESLRLNKHDPEAQKQHMQEVLSTSAADWKFVFGHHPPVSTGYLWGDPTILDQVVPILENNHIDVLFTGHDHNLQHIQKIQNSDLDYVVSGAGGRSLYAFNAENEDTIQGKGYQSLFFQASYGFVGVTVQARQLHVEYFTHVNENGQPTLFKLYEFYRYK